MVVPLPRQTTEPFILLEYESMARRCLVYDHRPPPGRRSQPCNAGSRYLCYPIVEPRPGACMRGGIGLTLRFDFVENARNWEMTP